MSDLADTTTVGTGAQPAPAGTIEHHGVSDISRIVGSYLKEFDAADGKRKLARADADTATENAIGERERILRVVAAIAHKAAWSEDDTTEAVKKAIELHAGNDKSKKSSLSTFASEIKLACGKRVRAQVGTIFDLARVAWDAEQLDDSEDAPRPLKKAFSRMYHTAQAVMRAAKESQPVPATTDELADFAIRTLEARRVDYKRVKARLDAIKKELQGFYDDFPVEGIGACLEFLGEVDTDDLKACRDRADQPERDAPAPQDDDSGEDAPAPQSSEEMLRDALADQIAA
jgi:hypothetical protein